MRLVTIQLRTVGCWRNNLWQLQGLWA